MQRTTKFPAKLLYAILITCGILILAASVEVIAKVKDLDYFAFVNDSLKAAGQVPLSYTDFTVSLMLNYFSVIILPVGIALNSYLAHAKFGLSKTFIWIWLLFTAAALALHVIRFEITSIFYYLYVLLYVLLIIWLLRLLHHLKSKEEATWAP